MIIAASVAVVVIVLMYVLLIRQRDLPYVEPLSPVAHLDERKAAVFENIRDANFEFLMGKLSTEDYQQTKADLQKELSEVNADIDGVLAKLGASAASVPTGAKRKTAVKGAPVAAVVAGQSSTSTESTAAITCPHCHARFNRPMRFCGECGKPMEGAAQ